jgi:flagellar protein FliS
MNYGKRLGHYQRTRIETTDPCDLVVLCYEKVIQNLIQAKAHYQEGAFERKSILLYKAMGIINELQCALDFDKGGQIATNLDAVYSYVTTRLLKGDAQVDLSAFDETINILSELKEAWERIADNQAEEMNSTKLSENTRPDAPQIAV